MKQQETAEETAAEWQETGAVTLLEQQGIAVAESQGNVPEAANDWLVSSVVPSDKTCSCCSAGTVTIMSTCSIPPPSDAPVWARPRPWWDPMPGMSPAPFSSFLCSFLDPTGDWVALYD